jgi:preprotein translocase subunit SecY
MDFEEKKNPFIKDFDFYKLKKNEKERVSETFQQKKSILTQSVNEKLFITFILIFLVKLGSSIPLPYINQLAYLEITKSNLSITNILNNFSTYNSVPSLLTLGIGPSINASIIMQLFLAINPDLKKMQKEEGESGRRKVAQYTRYLILFLSVVQSIFLTFSLRSIIFNWNFLKLIEISCLLTCGSMIVLWISEIITKKGITNGSSLLVFLNIVGNTPQQFQASLPFLSLSDWLILIITLVITIAGVIILQQSIRSIPIITSKISMQDFDNNLSRQKTFLPFKLNQAGVMPIVFASYLLPIVTSFSSFILLKINQLNIFPFLINFPKIIEQIIYFGFEFFLICLFTTFYSVLIIDPKDVSEDLQKAAFFIPGIRPGQQTFTYLDKLFQRQALIGGSILAFNAILLNFIGLVIKLPILQGIGIGSQIIIVGVTIEVIQKIRAIMISDIYIKYLKPKN